MKIDWSRFAEIVNAGKRFVLTSHMRADCDAVGSELGMAEILETLGKEVAIVNGEAVPQHIAFIDPQQKVKVLGDDIDLATCAAVDVVMVLDTSAWVQLGPMADVLRQTSATKIVVDHHVSQDDFGAECFKDTQAEATGRLVIEAADALGVALSPAMATPEMVPIRMGSSTRGSRNTWPKVRKRVRRPWAMAAPCRAGSLSTVRVSTVAMAQMPAARKKASR